MSIARQTLRSFRATVTTSTTAFRSLSTTRALLMADDANSNAVRSGGGQGDAFTKREQASEDYYVRQEEKKKLEALKKKIADSEAQLAKDRKHVEDLQKKGE